MRPSQVSVIIPTFNHQSKIERALTSVLNQDSFEQLSVYVSDDCSTDSTFSIASEVATPYKNVLVEKTDSNVGWYGNYTRLLNQCETEFVAILEGDDYWTETSKLTRQLRLLNDNQEIAGCFSDYDVVTQATGLKRGCELRTTKYQVLSAIDLIYQNYPGTLSTCFYRTKALKQVFEQVKPYNPVYDWVINTMIAEQGGFAFLPGVSVIYDVHADGLWSGLASNEQRKLVQHSLLALKGLLPQYACFIDDRKRMASQAA